MPLNKVRIAAKKRKWFKGLNLLELFVTVGWNTFLRWQRKTARIFFLTVPYGIAQLNPNQPHVLTPSPNTRTNARTIWAFTGRGFRWAFGHFKCHFLHEAIFAPHLSIFSPPYYLYPCLVTPPKLCASQEQGPWLTYWYPRLELFSQQMLVE